MELYFVRGISMSLYCSKTCAAREGDLVRQFIPAHKLTVAEQSGKCYSCEQSLMDLITRYKIKRMLPDEKES
jgi:hypothetical protein